VYLGFVIALLMNFQLLIKKRNPMLHGDIISVTTVCGGIRFLRVAFFTWITSLEKITFIFIFYVFMNKL
jgi:hypothetical protein